MDLSHIKLVAIDLDGTLLNEQKQVNDYSKKIIQKLSKTDIKVCFVTGRSYNDAIEFAKACEIKGCVVTSNGSEIRDAITNKLLFSSTFPKNIATDIIKCFRDSKEFMWVYTSDGVYYENNNELLDLFRKRWSEIKYEQSNFDSLSGGILKFLWLLRKDKALLLQKHFMNHYSDTVKGIFTNPGISDSDDPQKEITYLELLQKDISKGSAIEFLAKHYHINLKNILAFGDEDNDIEMLSQAGFAVSPSNAREHIKNIVDYVCDSHINSGVPKFIEEYLLNP